MSIAIRPPNNKLFMPFLGLLANTNLQIVELLLRGLLSSLEEGKISFVFNNGYKIEFNGQSTGPEATINVHSLKCLKRLATAGYLGLAEGYMAKEWTTPSLTKLFEFGTANEEILDKNLTGGKFIIWLNKTIHLFRNNSRTGSRKNIADHYDLGNAFFEKWLDPSLTYSSALFENSAPQSLAAAQKNKYRRIVETLGIKQNHQVLEIGCGWGGFAEYAARETGAQITAVTISKEQKDYALRRIKMAGLEGQVEILLRDYRDITGKFDKIVSIEMLEAVGEAYWPIYFQTLSKHLIENGMAVIQVITIPDEKFLEYRSTVDFIQKYIFPGGMLICPAKIRENSLATKLNVTNEYMLGNSYAQTLDSWRNSFLKNWHDIALLGFDERFKRMWEYYLAYTSAGFKSGAINVGQFCLTKF